MTPKKNHTKLSEKCSNKYSKIQTMVKQILFMVSTVVILCLILLFCCSYANVPSAAKSSCKSVIGSPFTCILAAEYD